MQRQPRQGEELTAASREAATLSTGIHPQASTRLSSFLFFHLSPLFSNECVTQSFNELPGKVNQKGSPLSKCIIKIGNGQRNTIIAGDGEHAGMTQGLSCFEKDLWDFSCVW